MTARAASADCAVGAEITEQSDTEREGEPEYLNSIAAPSMFFCRTIASPVKPKETALSLSTSFISIMSAMCTL